MTTTTGTTATVFSLDDLISATDVSPFGLNFSSSLPKPKDKSSASSKANEEEIKALNDRYSEISKEQEYLYFFKNMRSSVKDALQRGLLSPDDTLVAFEFENESLVPFTYPELSNWKWHNEGSLRHYGFEAVNRCPRTKSDIVKDINSLFSYLKDSLLDAGASSDRLLTNSSRTSTHLHVNVGHMTYLNIMCFAMTYIALEDFLSNFCGPFRQNNLFCLRAKDAEALLLGIQKELSEGLVYNSPVWKDTNRYGALNLASVLKFGSLEFRMMRGVSAPFDALIWLDAILAIEKFARQFKDPDELYAFFLKETPADIFPKMVLGDELFDKFNLFFQKFGGGSVEDSVREGFLLVRKVAREFKKLKTAEAYTMDLAVLVDKLQKLDKEKDDVERKLLDLRPKKKPATVSTQHFVQNVPVFWIQNGQFEPDNPTETDEMLSENNSVHALEDM